MGFRNSTWSARLSSEFHNASERFLQETLEEGGGKAGGAASFLLLETLSSPVCFHSSLFCFNSCQCLFAIFFHHLIPFVFFFVFSISMFSHCFRIIHFPLSFLQFSNQYSTFSSKFSIYFHIGCVPLFLCSVFLTFSSLLCFFSDLFHSALLFSSLSKSITRSWCKAVLFVPCVLRMSSDLQQDGLFYK